MGGRFTRLVFFCLFLCSFSTWAFTEAEKEARFIYQRLNGKILKAGTPIYNQMVDLVTKNQKREAALLATKESGFVGAVVRHWGSLLLTRDADPALLLNDSLAMVMGAVRDNMDARELLTGNFIYAGDPRLSLGRPNPYSSELYVRLEAQFRELDKVLYFYKPQWDLAVAREVAGVLTSRWWGSVHYSAGTNRRAVIGAFESFLCLPIDSWKRPNLPTFRIRQDIDRFPQGDARVFQTECRTCHSAMDAFAGAFANIDFRNNRLEWDSTVVPKYLAHADIYPDGYQTGNNSWLNFLYDDPQNMFGWGATMQGMGIPEFAKMMADTRVFSDCMVKRSIRSVCRSELGLNSPFVQEVSEDFRRQGYKLKDLFVDLAVHPKCKELVLQYSQEHPNEQVDGASDTASDIAMEGL